MEKKRKNRGDRVRKRQVHRKAKEKTKEELSIRRKKQTEKGREKEKLVWKKEQEKK